MNQEDSPVVVGQSFFETAELAFQLLDLLLQFFKTRHVGEEVSDPFIDLLLDEIKGLVWVGKPFLQDLCALFLGSVPFFDEFRDMLFRFDPHRVQGFPALVHPVRKAVSPLPV